MGKTEKRSYGMIAIIAAMASEIKELTKAMFSEDDDKILNNALLDSSEITTMKSTLSHTRKTKLAGTDVYTGRIGNQRIVLMQCGIGKVSAAMGAQAIISKYKPDIVINTGCAGALASGLNIGDMVVADAAVEWDLDTTALGNERGFIYALKKAKMTADSEMNKRIISCIPDNVKVSRGLIVSGDQFVSTDAQRNEIFRCFPDAMCAEMEGAAIGHVCAQNGIPFCILRTMSDSADRDSKVDYAIFSKKAGKASADVLIRMFKK